jgi:hypothetical protein
MLSEVPLLVSTEEFEIPQRLRPLRVLVNFYLADRIARRLQ